ncbi:hypothetical protein [Brevibacterium antiquum]|uniref:PEGA domain-containing protein n=1 Tax=Brevibacterium antiquum TaxID=234835 RepID=A0A2H1KPM2_9MICO|nr:hypothetical protein [Brevibacterium antiquum]SMY01686.1 hypothetical protein BANT10_03307 [Brevibacterium antiquum]
MNYKRSLTVIITIFAVVAVVVAGAVWYFVAKPTKVLVTITSQPHTVEITINGESFGARKSGKTFPVETKEDSLSITASADGFADDTIVEPINGKQVGSFIGLVPQTDEAEKTLREEGDLDQQEDATEKYLRESEKLRADWPILDELPRETMTYRAYQGESEDGDHDFGIHLFLYPDNADQGREDFNRWLKSINEDPHDYEIVEEMDNGPKKAVVPPLPTRDEVEALSRDDITDPKTIKSDNLESDAAALQFASATTTWHASKDTPHSGFNRTHQLMSKSLADSITEPERPTYTPKWFEAADNDAESYSWPIDIYEGTGSNSFEVEVCWAWVSETHEPVIEGPRKYSITMGDDDGRPVVTGYEFEDPSNFVASDTDQCLSND